MVCMSPALPRGASAIMPCSTHMHVVDSKCSNAAQCLQQELIVLAHCA